MNKFITILVVFGFSLASGQAEAGGNPLPGCQDINEDGSSDVSDAVFFLSWRFLGGPEPDCPSSGAHTTGCPPEGRFIDNGDGTVTDNCTGLMWQKDTADASGGSWCAALSYCEELTFAGHDDWRLPNIPELLSIVDYGRSGPAIDPVFTVSSSRFVGYWSSTSAPGNPDAWHVYFSDGRATFRDEGLANLVCAVRNAP